MSVPGSIFKENIAPPPKFAGKLDFSIRHCLYCRLLFNQQSDSQQVCPSCEELKKQNKIICRWCGEIKSKVSSQFPMVCDDCLEKNKKI